MTDLASKELLEETARALHVFAQFGKPPNWEREPESTKNYFRNAARIAANIITRDAPALGTSAGNWSGPRYEQHVSTESDDTVVGHRFHIDDQRSVWCGEISETLFLEHGCEDLGSDGGFFAVLFDNTKPVGEQTTVLGKAPDGDAAYSLSMMLAYGWHEMLPAADTRNAGDS